MTSLPPLLWRTPAGRFDEATPVGNGALGAMIYGGPTGRITLNDSSAWSGTPAGPDQALERVLAAGAGPERLAQARAAIDAGDDDRAEALVMTFEGPWSQEFLPLGELAVGIDGEADPESYTRELDLLTAVVDEHFTVNGVAIRRTTWADREADAVVVRLTTGEPTTHHVSLGSWLPGEVSVVDAGFDLLVELPVDGAPVHEPQAVSHRFDTAAARAAGFDPAAAVVLRRSGDGRVSQVDDRMEVHMATTSFVVVTAETNGRLWWQSLPPVDRSVLACRAATRAQSIAGRDAAAILDRHCASTAASLGQSQLVVGEQAASAVDVATLLRRGDDAVLASVMYAFGRYLLWSSSRAGSPPANLQGIWNESPRPPWSSNYTININTEMNYWAAERTGLSVLHEPLIELVSRLRETGSRVASRLYGTRGWVAHHNTDPWGFALPAGDGRGAPSWAYWPMGGLWLTEHVWQHWRFGLDRDYLASTAWPIVRGAAEFALDWLVDDPADEKGRLRTVPSTSPENGFRAADGTSRSVTASVAMDIALIRSTLEHARDAAEILGTAADLIEEISLALPRLPRPAVTPAGLLREWGDDREAVDPHHRHMSQMVGVFPLDQIDLHRTPDLADAARRTLDERGPGAMGWSWAWKIANRARLGQGDIALELFREATHAYTRDPSVNAPVDGSEWGGLLPNLFSTHPPFQIDGNLGFPAALVELLVAPGSDPIRLLPALPTAWPDGHITGVRVDGGISVDLRWRGGRPAEVRLERRAAGAPERVSVETGERSMEVDLPESGPVDLDLAELRT